MKKLWFEFYVEKPNELIDVGIDEKIADDMAALYAENCIKEYVNEKSDN